MSDRLTAPTRQALLGRLEPAPRETDLLSDVQRRTLEDVCVRLVPEPALVKRIALAETLEAKLAQGLARGWRYAETPSDLDLHTHVLDTLETAAHDQFSLPFSRLRTDQQDTLLTSASKGELSTRLGEKALRLGFEDLLTTLVEIFYAHPLVQVSIGYDGMADARLPLAVGVQAVDVEGRALAD